MLGEASTDIAFSVSAASDGSIYIAGNTVGSIDGQINYGSSDAFIAKFNSDGSKAEVVWFFCTGPIVNLEAGHRP